MAKNLPWDLIEEILSRVPSKSLVRFRTVCKRWNALLEDKTFINNHKTTFRFILATRSKIYSVSVNPTIEVHELTLDIPTLESQIPRNLIDCDGLLLCDMGKGAVVCNPWLRQTRWIKPEGNQTNFKFFGIGYDDDNNGYKTLAAAHVDSTMSKWKIHDFSSDAWKDQKDVLMSGGSITSTQGEGPVTLHTTNGVSLNGTWYRFGSYNRTKYLFFLVYFDFSTETFYKFCDLPCEDTNHNDALVLSVFRGNQFSLLKQSHLTKKIQIWVTKNKIHKRSGRDVEWVNFMEVSVPNLPALVQIGSHSQPSYFIDDKRDDKRIIVCSCDGNGRPWIYVITESKLISKIRLDSVVDPWPLHCAYFPSLVLVPGRQRDQEEELQVRLSFVWLFVWLFRKLKVFFGKINYF